MLKNPVFSNHFQHCKFILTIVKNLNKKMFKQDINIMFKKTCFLYIATILHVYKLWK